MSELWRLEQVGLGSRLREISVVVRSGVTAVLGPSGAGKTSLLDLLVGFEKPDRGTVTASLPGPPHPLPLFWVPQDDGLWPHLTVREHLAAGLPVDSDRSHIEGLLGDFDLGPVAGCRPATLSQGERARLSVARALATRAAVLVMDEPLAHVDPERVRHYWEVVRRRLQERGASLVFATHVPRAVLAEAQRVICLRHGCLLYAGDVGELYHRPATRELAGCLGEANWLEPGEAKLWLSRQESGPRCFRPEQLTVTPMAQSPLVVESSRFEGAVAEIELRHESSGEVRRFFHRPAVDHLVRGTRVVLKAVVTLLCALALAGCGRASSGRILPVREIHVWVVPTDQSTQPAPRSVAIGPDDEVVVLDTAGRVLVYDAAGTLQRQWRMPDTSVGKPEGVWVLRDGTLVVCDTHYHRVVVFAPDGTVRRMFGEEGRGPGEFIYPVSVTADAAENLYVAEYGSNDRVQKFTRDGEFVLSFGSFGTGPGQFQRPSGIAWHEGRVYVADAFNNRLQVFTDQGQYVGLLGAADAPLGLHFPYDLKLGSDGALYVVEYGAARITRVAPDGRLLGRYGGPGPGLGQFATPWGIAVDSQMRIRVADTGNRRLVDLKL